MGKTRIKLKDFQKKIVAIEDKTKKEVKLLNEEKDIIKAVEKVLGCEVEVDVLTENYITVMKNGQEEHYFILDEFGRINQFLYEFIEYEYWEHSNKHDSLTQEEYLWDMINNNQMGKVVGSSGGEIKFYVGKKPFYLYRTAD